MGQQSILNLKCDKGLAESVSETLEALVLEEGQLATASNCFYSRQGVLRLWRPFLEEVQTGLATDVLAACWMEDWENLIVLSASHVRVYGGDPLALSTTLNTSTATQGTVAPFGDHCLIANGVDPLLAVWKYGSQHLLKECGSQGGYELPAQVSPSIELHNSSADVASFNGFNGRHRKVVFVRTFLARQTGAIGVISCALYDQISEKIADATNVVLVGSLAAESVIGNLKSLIQFTECIFYFDYGGSTLATTYTVKLTHSGGASPDIVWVLNPGDEQPVAERLYTSCSGTGCVQLNGMITPHPAGVTVKDSRCFTCRDAVDENRICVSDVLDAQNFDHAGKGGWFPLPFAAKSIIEVNDGLIVCGFKDGEPYLIVYVGNWPEDVTVAASYLHGVASQKEVKVAGHRILMVSGGGLIVGEEADKQGGFHWKDLLIPERRLAADTWTIVTLRDYNLLCLVNGRNVLVSQISSGQWTTWTLDELGAATATCFYGVENVLYLLASDGTLYAFNFEPTSDHNYEVEVCLGSSVIAPAGDVQLEGIATVPPLPTGSQVTVTGWDSISHFDGSFESAEWTETFVADLNADERGFWPFALKRTVTFVLVKIVLPVAIEKELKFALREVNLVLNLDATYRPEVLDSCPG